MVTMATMCYVSKCKSRCRQIHAVEAVMLKEYSASNTIVHVILEARNVIFTIFSKIKML